MDKFTNLPKKYLIVGGFSCLIALFALGVFLWWQQSKPLDEPLSDWKVAASSSKTEVASSKESDQQVYVDVKGAVKIPGMYRAAATMRIWDVIALAGGVTEEADTKSVNYSQKVTDQMIIYVPKNGEVPTEPSEGIVGSAQQSEQTATAKVSLNSATEAELQTISGIGAKKAQDIIQYREANGPFKSVAELKNVPGIGEKTVERFKDFLTVD